MVVMMMVVGGAIDWQFEKIYRKTVIKSIYASTILKMGENGWPIAVN